MRFARRATFGGGAVTLGERRLHSPVTYIHALAFGNAGHTLPAINVVFLAMEPALFFWSQAFETIVCNSESPGGRSPSPPPQSDQSQAGCQECDRRRFGHACELALQ